MTYVTYITTSIAKILSKYHQNNGNAIKISLK